MEPAVCSRRPHVHHVSPRVRPTRQKHNHDSAVTEKNPSWCRFSLKASEDRRDLLGYSVISHLSRTNKAIYSYDAGSVWLEFSLRAFFQYLVSCLSLKTCARTETIFLQSHNYSKRWKHETVAQLNSRRYSHVLKVSSKLSASNSELIKILSTVTLLPHWIQSEIKVLNSFNFCVFLCIYLKKYCFVIVW